MCALPLPIRAQLTRAKPRNASCGAQRLPDPRLTRRDGAQAARAACHAGVLSKVWQRVIRKAPAPLNRRAPTRLGDGVWCSAREKAWRCSSAAAVLYFCTSEKSFVITIFFQALLTLSDKHAHTGARPRVTPRRKQLGTGHRSPYPPTTAPHTRLPYSPSTAGS
jgi:hypothetical protein